MFGLAFGLLQAPAAATSVREFVAWPLLTELFGLAGFYLAILGFILAFGLFAWIPFLTGVAAIVGLVGAAVTGGAIVGFGQSAVFALRDPERDMRLWPIASGLGSLALAPSMLGLIGSCGPQDVLALAIGGGYGLLTAVPFASLMVSGLSVQ